MSTRMLAGSAVVAMLACQPDGAAFAQQRPAVSFGKTQAGDENKPDIDSEHLFGFLEGSDVGDAGEKEAELEPLGRFGKRGGSYAATSTVLFVKYTPIDNFRVAPAITFASHNISNVPSLDDRDQFAIEGVGAELRYRLLDREQAPFGFTLSALPTRNRIDATTGLPVDQYGIEFAALLDKNLIPNRLFAALNLLYEPEWTHSRITGEWERDSTIGIGAALSAQVLSGLFVGTEVRYFRKYEGISLNTLVGEALFVGPSVYAKLTKQWFASVAWNVQVAGQAVGEPGPLDLTNFERHEVRARFGANF